MTSITYNRTEAAGALVSVSKLQTRRIVSTMLTQWVSTGHPDALGALSIFLDGQTVTTAGGVLYQVYLSIDLNQTNSEGESARESLVCACLEILRGPRTDRSIVSPYTELLEFGRKLGAYEFLETAISLAQSLSLCGCTELRELNSTPASRLLTAVVDAGFTPMDEFKFLSSIVETAEVDFTIVPFLFKRILITGPHSASAGPLLLARALNLYLESGDAGSKLRQERRAAFVSDYDRWTRDVALSNSDSIKLANCGLAWLIDDRISDSYLVETEQEDYYSDSELAPTVLDLESFKSTGSDAFKNPSKN